MKYLLFLFCLGLFSCSSKQVGSNRPEFDIPHPQSEQNTSNQRATASDENYLKNSYERFFEGKNDKGQSDAAVDYITRLQQVRKLTRFLNFLMETKGHPRKRLMQKFQDDLDKQIAYLSKLETESPTKNLPDSWLPKKDSYQYGAKIRALQAVVNSSAVMNLLEDYLSSIKVLEDDSMDQNFYYGLMRRGLKVLGRELERVDGEKGKDLVATKLSYGEYLASVALVYLHKALDEKSRFHESRIKAALKDLQKARKAEKAKYVVDSPEFKFASLILMNVDYAGSSDIEGIRADMDTKIATYFGLEMIKHLYAGLN